MSVPFGLTPFINNSSKASSCIFKKASSDTSFFTLFIASPLLGLKTTLAIVSGVAFSTLVKIRACSNFNNSSLALALDSNPSINLLKFGEKSFCKSNLTVLFIKSLKSSGFNLGLYFTNSCKVLIVFS